MPSDTSSERIGLTEIGAEIRFLAAGDFDGDLHRDLVIRAQIYGDTSLGNTNADYDLFTIIVFWNDGTGHYSVNDTTQLEITGADRWGAGGAMSNDWTNDGADDLLMSSYSTAYVRGQKTIKIADLHIFTGRAGQRWGRNGIERTPAWSWWNHPSYNKLGPLVDQDGDGAMDIPLYVNNGTSGNTLSVLYGKPLGGLPDTTEWQTISLNSAGGNTSLLSDVTGDGLPEIIMNAGAEYMLKIYAGRPGQRLLEQYGSGNDEPQPDKGWWRRPWAALWHAHKLSDGWTPSGGATPRELNDGNFDGINDIWLPSSPYILCYSAGDRLDSLIDGIIELPLIGWEEWLGDIDGSGVPMIALYTDALHAIVLYKANPEIPRTGKYRKLPDLPAGVAQNGDAREMDGFSLTAAPNPAHDDVRISWMCEGLNAEAQVVVRDILGREVGSWSVPASEGTITWQNDRMVGGVYFITLTIGNRSDTTQVVIK
jgi:hypothetical protein